MLSMLLAVTLSLPKYYAVHIDQPRDRAALEDADRRNAALRKAYYDAHKLERPPLLMFTTADGTLYSLRPRESFADFDKPSSLPDDLRKQLAAISEDAHKSLRGHHSEIWEVDRQTSVVAGTHAPKYARLISETIRPAMFQQYSDAIDRLHAAVAKTKGVTLLAFFSEYGDGAYHYLVLSDEPVDLFALVDEPTRKQWRDCVVESKTAEVTARPDLSASEPAQWLR
jgi:hypothetical protein